MKIEDDIILLAGPTASGKTSLAIELAQASGGVIINTDSMQVYRELQIISARPGPDEISLCPHLLFGHVPASQSYSVARWQKDVVPLIAKHRKEHRQMIFVGGTGLYFTALLKGLSPVPEISVEIREKWRNYQCENPAGLHAELVALDPGAAQTLEIGDSQRIARALEVFESTGRSIMKWQAEPGVSPLPKDASVSKLLLYPPRSGLHKRIEARFDAMVEAGALAEVEALLALKLSTALPAMKAIGVPQLAGYLAGEIELDEAITKAKAATRQYAKRQSTWFNNTFDQDWQMLKGDSQGV